jgi:glycosyltransferase involved in cell wall biosynthesis
MAMFSWYESFPLPPIEAMACGCAVVSTKYGTEDYLEDGVTGRLINSFDINGSVKIINGLIHDPDVLLQYVKNARNVVGRFTWQEQSEKLNAFLSNLPSRNYVDVLEHKGNYDELRKIENI